ncbi:MAG TPA: ABC transporter ATP-binding protein [Candidatus Limnocylindrales bacterium]|nr:ABC transporter ATP-binding protein [Candidatus Limnocylindrales bacterium]
MAVLSRAAPAQPVAQTELVRVRDVIKVYREAETETVALRGANLELRAGEFVCLVGKSGSGKSTLLSLIAGLALPTAGQIIIEQRDITRLDESARAALRSRKIGLVFQSGNLIPFLTAAENVRLALRLSGRSNGSRRATDLLGEVGLSSRLHHLPRQLSGGEAQRVAVAMALAGEPDLLMADELTGELDSATADQVMTVITGLWESRKLTVLVVTHNPEVAARGQRQLHLRDGLVIES